MFLNSSLKFKEFLSIFSDFLLKCYLCRNSQLLSKQQILKNYEQIVNEKQLAQNISKENHHFQISNLVGSSLSFVISESFKKSEKPFLLIFTDKEEAAYYLNDLEQLLNDKDVLFYPGSYRRPYQIEETDNANVLLRSEVLNRINSRENEAMAASTKFFELANII